MRFEGNLLSALLALVGTPPGRVSSLAFSNLRAFSNNYLDSLQPASPDAPSWARIAVDVIQKPPKPLPEIEGRSPAPTSPALDPWFRTQKGQQQKAQAQAQAQQFQTPQQQPPSRPQAELSDAARYLDAQGAAYVTSLAEGRRQRRAQQQTPSPSEATPSGGGSALPSRGSALPSRESASASSPPPPTKPGAASAPPAWAVAAAGASTAPAPPPAPAPPLAPPPLPSSVAKDDRLAAIEARLSEIESELASLRAENRALKSAGWDLLRRFRELAAHLDEMEGYRMELADLADRWERSLLECVEAFPDEDELESYEWLMRR